MLIEGSQNNAEQQVQQLQALIDFTSPSNKKGISLIHSNKFEIQKNRSKVAISWKNNIGLQPFLLGFVLLFFIAIGYAIFGSVFPVKKWDAFTLLFCGMGCFIFGIFFYIMIAAILKMIKNATTTYAIEISENELNYLEKDKSGCTKKIIRFEKNSIHAISYSFDSMANTKNMYIFTQTQFNRKQAHQLSLSLASIREHIQLENDILTITFDNLTPTEILYLENFMRNELPDCV